MARRWELRDGQVLVVEDASTASLVIVGRELRDRRDKVSAVEEVLERLRTGAL